MQVSVNMADNNIKFPESVEKETLEIKIWEALEKVKDPEIPFISVVDLGMIADVKIENELEVKVKMMPTFTACPALEILQKGISQEVEKRVKDLGVTKITVEIVREPTWNSNRITEKGKKILKEFGLAPPPFYEGEIGPDQLLNVPCPYCDSNQTELKSTFGSTLCRAIHYCRSCLQSFEQFKPV